MIGGQLGVMVTSMMPTPEMWQVKEMVQPASTKFNTSYT
jgi:hypothetical protein